MQNNPIEDQGDLLIVDDLTDNLRILSNTLLGHGYRVRAVKNGAMALVGAKAVPPDVVLLDIRMPSMDGYEVCRQFKSEPQLCDIPIIFLSALDEMEDKAKAFAMGGVDYITKPFQTEEVLARVKNQLTIQQLKKLVAKQRQQLEQLEHITGALADLPDPDRAFQLQAGDQVNHNGEQQTTLSAIATILDYSARLCESPTIDPEQHAALKVIYQNGQTLLKLVNTQLGSPMP